jgi:hypothetical protein
MPGDVMVSDGITGCGLTPLFGMLSVDSVVNTDGNCSFKMFEVQKEQRHAYNTYIEKIILDLPTNDPDQSFNNQSKPKKLFSFNKCAAICLLLCKQHHGH